MDEAQHQKYLQIHKLLLTVWAIAQKYWCILLKRSKTTLAICPVSTRSFTCSDRSVSDTLKNLIDALPSTKNYLYSQKL